MINKQECIDVRHYTGYVLYLFSLITMLLIVYYECMSEILKIQVVDMGINEKQVSFQTPASSPTP